jgi:hypothetical protein
MKPYARYWLIIVFFCFTQAHGAAARETAPVRLAVGFLDHAACAHIARNQNGYRQAGLSVRAFDSYATGIGALMMRAENLVRVDIILVCLMLLSVMSLLFEKFFCFLEEKITGHWR